MNLCPYYACYAQPDFVSPWDNTDVVLTLPNSPFPLAQCTGLEVDEPFGVVARSSVVDASFELEDVFDKVHALVKTPLEVSHDVLVHDWSPPFGFDDNVLPNPLDHFHVSPICSLPSISPEYSLDAAVDNHKICDSNVDLGYEDNTFDVHGEKVDNFISLAYLRGYDFLSLLYKP